MQQPPSSLLPVAIIGGGLCGLGLACALTKRSIAYKIYEARSSFQELGAGINIGPNTLRAFSLIDASLSQAFLTLCSGNPPGKEVVWMQLRAGAPTGKFADAAVLAELQAAPTGNMTVSRNELLRLLAETAGMEHAVFGKKLVGLAQDDEKVRMTFADGSEVDASVLVACDGIHSAVRKAMLSPGDPAAAPRYSGHGAYRAILSATKLAAAVGEEMARTSNILLGPEGYIIMYPIDRGENVNVGLWVSGPREWESRDWVLPGQGSSMRKSFVRWGETAHKIMDLVGDVPFFATHHHVRQPGSCYSGRVCLIGDAAHAMPPHQGAGSGQAMEDAYVLAEVLETLLQETPSQKAVELGFQAYESVRRPRSQGILESSVDAFDTWADFFQFGMTEEEVRARVQEAHRSLESIWFVDLAQDARSALTLLKHAHMEAQADRQSSSGMLGKSE
nr:6-methylsalicylic acid decarboxylase ata [Quercus suber]